MIQPPAMPKTALPTLGASAGLRSILRHGGQVKTPAFAQPGVTIHGQNSQVLLKR